MAELLLGEMMREWRFGSSEGLGTEEEEEEFRLNSSSSSSRREGMGLEGEEGMDYEEEDVEGMEKPKGKVRRRGNERVKPDVVTFTAV